MKLLLKPNKVPVITHLDRILKNNPFYPTYNDKILYLPEHELFSGPPKIIVPFPEAVL